MKYTIFPRRTVTLSQYCNDREISLVVTEQPDGWIAYVKWCEGELADTVDGAIKLLCIKLSQGNLNVVPGNDLEGVEQ